MGNNKYIVGPSIEFLAEDFRTRLYNIKSVRTLCW